MTPKKILGSELELGQTIKAHGRIYTITDIEPPGTWARLMEARMTNGEMATFNVFEDSEYELHRQPGRTRPQIVKVSLPPELAARVERARLADETTPAAIVRLAEQCLADWHPEPAR